MHRLERLENDQRDLPARPGLVVGVGWVELDRARPESEALFGRRHARPAALPRAPSLDLNFGVGDEVEEPHRVPRVPSLRSHDDEAVAIHHVEEWQRHRLSAATAADGEEQDRCSSDRATELTAARSVEDTVHGRGGAEHQPRRR